MPESLLLDIQNLLITLALIMPRTLVCLIILPAFLRTLTGMARNGAAMAIALPAALPTFAFVQEMPPDYFMVAMLILKEIGIGLMLGVLISIPLWVIQSVGSIIDMQRSPIQIQSPQDQDSSAIGTMLQQAVMLVMIQAGLLVALFRILIESYGIWPAFGLTPPYENGHFDVVLKRLGEFFWYIIVYGGPVLIVLIMVDFGFAILGVFASNLQVSFASSPVKSLLGIFIVLVYWSTLSHYVAGDFSRLLDLAASLIQAAPR